MAHPIIRLLQIHNLTYDQVQILNINDNGSFDFIGPDTLTYRISVEGLVCLSEVGPEPVVPVAVKRPRGWHLKAVYVDPDGTVFHKGVRQ